MNIKKKLSKPKKSAKKGNVVVALDIGTEFVKAIVGRVHGDQVEIVGVGRTRQQLADMQSGAIADIAGVVDNCDVALSQAERQAGLDAKNVVIGIAGELVKGTTTMITYRRSNSAEPIDETEMQRIIDKVQERTEQNAKKQLALETGNKNVDVKLVNSALVSIQIDGYKVTNPIGFQGGEVSIGLYTAFAPMIHIGALERTAEELDLNLTAVAAEPFAVARSVIGTDASSTMSAILIDVGGGTTDIAVVNDGGVQGTKMFGIGGRSFTRTVSSDFSIDFEAAEALKIKLGTGKLSEKDESHILESINKTLDVWISGVELALSEFDMIDHLPNRILLCGGGSSLDPLYRALTERDWYKSLPFTRQPTVQHIKPHQVVGIVDKTDSIQDHTYITAMGLLRVGVDTATGVGGDQTVKDKFNKILSV
jgi:cell division protein FtsA